VWLYEFNYKHNHSLARRNIKVPGTALKAEDVLPAMTRPTHAGEEAMLFSVFNEMMGPHSEEEEKYSKKFVRFITSFAKEGDPAKFSPGVETKDWRSIEDGQITHYVFGKYSTTSVGFPFQHRMKWWDSLPVFWKKNKHLSAAAIKEHEMQNGDGQGSMEEQDGDTEDTVEEFATEQLLDVKSRDEL